jgi:hypothetical protein
MMNIKNYIAGELRQEYQYQSFVPSMINHTFTLGMSRKLTLCWKMPRVRLVS